MSTLLLELFSEEIPSRMQRGACDQLALRMSNGFKEKYNIEGGWVKTFVSPRHLAIQLAGLPDVQPDVTEEKKGPKVGAPEQAMKGFLNSVGLTAAQCEQRDGYYFAMIHRKGRPTSDVAKEIIETVLKSFVWPKSMRWGAGTQTWVRPLHRIVCLLDTKIIPVQFGALTASNITEGHRFLHTGEVKIEDAAQYADTLKKAHVLVHFEDRRVRIQNEVQILAATQNLIPLDEEGLTNEVTGLVEWPTPLLGTFDKKFLELPPEVLVSEMKVHQRYFALIDGAGKLTNKFIIVANMVTSDKGKTVIAGNERVLHARLSDGEFYWEQDKKKPLSDWAKGLADVVFHAKVGMMSEKVKRIEKYAITIAETVVGGIDIDQVRQAAKLCKADLTTGMVGEFPDLQGIMGCYYAQNEKLPAEISTAIRDHYKPLGAMDAEPQSTIAAIISIADKLDSIISLFGAGEKPTGSKDPFALRRATIGIMRITLKFRWNVDIAKFTNDPEIIEFFRDRLKQMLRDDGLKHDVVDAALNIKEKTFVPNVITEQARSLAKWTESKEGEGALAAIKRALNILAAEEKKAKTQYQFATAQKATFAKPAEQQLLAALQEKVVSLDALSKLAAPINTFFDDVMVTEEGHREARLSLLAGVRDAANQIADFSKIEG